MKEAELPDDPNELKAIIEALLKENQAIASSRDQLVEENQALLSQTEGLTVKVDLLERLVAFFQASAYCAKNEKRCRQEAPFNEPEVFENSEAPEYAESTLDAEAQVEAPSTDDKASQKATADTAKKPRKKSGRKPLPHHLPRHTQVHELSDDELTCSCGCQRNEIGEETSEQLEIIPAQVYVIKHVRKKYACPSCQSNFKTAPLPAQPIPKSNAAPGLLAYIATAKYIDSMPLYRQETAFERLDIKLPRATQANWMIQVAKLCQPLVNLMQDQLLESAYLHMDETTVQVLREPNRQASTKSYMWVRLAKRESKPIVLFDYRPSRAGDIPVELLEGFQGYLQTDDYKAYNKIATTEGITQLGCWAHARRKFIEAQRINKSKKKKDTTTQMLDWIGLLYAIEAQIKDKSPDERYHIRQTQSQPILDKIKARLDEKLNAILPTSPTGKALHYLHNNWSKLIIYITDGQLNIDNNPVENAIRPFAVGRKNWLFANSQKGADASALLYSLIETAKANELNSFLYLATIFKRLPSCQTLEDYEALLPWNIEIEDFTVEM